MGYYIKTEDGIYRIEYIKEVDGEVCYFDDNFRKIGTEKTLKILKEGGIEDVCDFYIKKSKEEGNDYFEAGKNCVEILDEKYKKTNLKFYDYFAMAWVKGKPICVAKVIGVDENGKPIWENTLQEKNNVFAELDLSDGSWDKKCWDDKWIHLSIKEFLDYYDECLSGDGSEVYIYSDGTKVYELLGECTWCDKWSVLKTSAFQEDGCENFKEKMSIGKYELIGVFWFNK